MFRTERFVSGKMTIYLADRACKRHDINLVNINMFKLVIMYLNDLIITGQSRSFDFLKMLTRTIFQNMLTLIFW